MTGVPVSPRRVFGVDFSAAADAGLHIWVCRAHPGGDGIRIESVDPLADLPGGERHLEGALEALVRKVLDAPRSAWGFDFSFGLPLEVLSSSGADQPPDWVEQLRMIDACASPDEMKDLCLARAEGRELRRRTDDLVATPFSPYNLRVYRQTYHGIEGVLRPLRGQPGVAILPFDALPAMDPTDAEGRLPFNVGRPGAGVPHTYLMETCPASLLLRLDYLPELNRYKGKADWQAERRDEILRRLVRDGLGRAVGRSLRERIIADPNGDGLDAVLAAVGAWRGYRDYDHTEIGRDPRYATEGFVYL
jgi:hypothetical protein